MAYFRDVLPMLEAVVLLLYWILVKSDAGVRGAIGVDGGGVDGGGGGGGVGSPVVTRVAATWKAGFGILLEMDIFEAAIAVYEVFEFVRYLYKLFLNRFNESFAVHEVKR